MGNSLIISGNPAQRTGWQFEEQEIKGTWEGGFAGFTSSEIKYVRINIDPDFPQDLKNIIMNYNGQSVADYWDGISSKLVVCMAGDPRLNGVPSNKIFDVTYYSVSSAKAIFPESSMKNIDDIFGSPTVWGICLPQGVNSQPWNESLAYLGTDDNWLGATIILNTIYSEIAPNSFYGASTEEKMVTMVHELGHALKLRHLGDAYFGNDNASPMLSIMNWGDSTIYYNTKTAVPSWHDKFSLILKWGE